MVAKEEITLQGTVLEALAAYCVHVSLEIISLSLVLAGTILSGHTLLVTR